jgi:hypothetical protein
MAPASLFQSAPVQHARTITIELPPASLQQPGQKKKKTRKSKVCSFVLEVSKVEDSRLALVRRRVPSIAGCRVRWEQERFGLARRVSDSRRGRDSKDGLDNRMRTVFTNQGYISRFPLRWKRLRVRSIPSSGDGKAKRQRTLPVARAAHSSRPKSACFC